MGPGRLAVAVVAAFPLVLIGLGGKVAPAASTEINHAAVVVDTGAPDGQVRKFCLAFPEESITGAEALRRIDVDVVFASYGSRGQAVCALSGVGCPAGDCFCDGSRYWAYYRAGPGGAPYEFSSSGVSSTQVRNGDVEGWRWGSGQAPPAATVGEVCDVPEPPPRTASAGGDDASAPPPAPSGSTTTTTTTTAAGAATGEPSDGAGAGGGGAPATTVAPAPPGGVGASGAAAAPSTSAPAPAPAPVGVPSREEGVGEPTTTVAPGFDETATGGASAADDESAARDRVASRRDPDAAGGGSGGVLGLVGFAAVLAAVLGWRAKLRRANVRPTTTDT